VTLPRWSVPESWKWVQAADVATIVGGGTPSTKDGANFAEPGSGTSWIGPADLTGYTETYIGKGRRDLSPKGLAASGATIMPVGTVLFSSRAPIGYCAIAANPISTNQGFKSWVCADEMLPEFVRHYLRASVEYVDSLASGTTFREVSGKRVAGMAFPLPPAAEQRRIVAKLDALIARLTRARTELDRVPVLAANLRSTALAELYRAIVEESGTSSIEHFVETLDQGWSPKCESHPAPDDAWGVLKTTAIQPLAFRPQENKALPAGLAPRSRIEVRPGDVLVTRAGPRVRCGITCFVRETRSKLMLADKMYRIRCKPDRASPAYLALMLNAPQSLALIESMKTGISDSGLNLTQEKFLSVPIPNLSIEKQEGVVRRLETVFARADRLEADATRARALLDRLEAAILARAFRGELVPQDPNDEPASVLLDRIRAKRAAAPKPKRGRGTKMTAGG
jgi:type I restriction enzyme, S subunit